MNEIKLWRKNSLGLGEWRIWVGTVGENAASIHYAHRVVAGGAEVVHDDVVRRNQSGRSLEAQVELEVNSRVSRQLDKGYKRSREDALQGSTNQLGLVNPMLAQPIERVSLSGVVSGYVQPKLDGHRLLVRCSDEGVLAYTRKGKLVDTIDHITAELPHFDGQDFTLDGELYLHGERLQGISSLIKRKQPRTLELRYHVYDLCERVLPYAGRLTILQQLFSTNEFRYTELVETNEVKAHGEYTLLDIALAERDRYRRLGYEGAMLRLSIRGYEDAKRSDQLLKVKEWPDMEGTCVAIKPSKDSWAICTLRLDNGKQFDISAPGTVLEKTDVLKNQSLFISRRLTFQYATLTADGLPFHASALRWRDDL